jgi:type IV secretory pathway TrbD component
MLLGYGQRTTEGDDMLHGSARTKLVIRLLIGLASALLGAALHLLVMFTVGLLVLVVAVLRFNQDRRGGGGW